jgi:hypothetical protein
MGGVGIEFGHGGDLLRAGKTKDTRNVRVVAGGRPAPWRRADGRVWRAREAAPSMRRFYDNRMALTNVTPSATSAIA